MARHIPLYKAALELLRAMAVSSQLVNLLLPQKNSNSPSISSLLKTMKTCVDTYASKLRSASYKSSNEKYVIFFFLIHICFPLVLISENYCINYLSFVIKNQSIDKFGRSY